MYFRFIPFLKILLPYVIGIGFVFNIGQPNNTHVYFIFSFCFLIFSFFIEKLPFIYKSFKTALFILSINVFLFVLAFETCLIYNQKNNKNHYSHYLSNKPQQFIAVITDVPVITNHKTKISINISAIKNNNKWHYATGNSILYLKTDSSLNLNVGESILIKSRFNSISEPKNPKEFNYKKFLELRNIFHTVFVSTNQINKISVPKTYNASTIGANIKSKLILILKNSGLTQNAFSICSALLVGYDDEIDNDVVQSFSHSGTLHVLSVSGMHTGILYVVLMFLFSLIDKHNLYKKTRFLFVLIFLCLFVLITGLSPSVLRAALMLSLLLFGKSFFRQGNAYNTLVLSAFILLIFNPFLIFDVGFLLSYFAVFGIMYCYPLLQKQIVFDNYIINYLWSSTLISISATLFTLPISLYYFHQFPIWFILSNIIVIPASLLIMAFTVLLFLFYKISAIYSILIYFINSAIRFLIWVVDITDNSTYGFIDYISFSKLDFIFLYVSICLFFIIIKTRQYKFVVITGFLVICWICVSVFNFYKISKEKELVIFNVKNTAVFGLRLGNYVYLNTFNLKNKDFNNYIKPYLVTIPGLCLRLHESKNLEIGLTHVVHCCPSKKPPVLSSTKYIILSNDCFINLKTIYKTKPLLIADCSNSYNFVKKLKRECARFNIPFYSVKEQGAFQTIL